ncbi:hypothetical protein E2320_002110 [Naja naja]|nr:hypothetical protein E2320_002110 [Naja naja]
MCSGSPVSFSLAASMTENSLNTWLMDISLANGQRAAVKGEDNIYVPEIGETFYNVLYVPALDLILLIISRLDRQGYKILFAGG